MTTRASRRPVNPDNDSSLHPSPIKSREIIRLKPAELTELRRKIAAGQHDDPERAAYWLDVFKEADGPR